MVLTGSRTRVKMTRFLLVVFSGIFLSACASTSEIHSGKMPEGSSPLSVLVLPFSNLTTTPDAGKSVTIILISELLRTNSLRVLSADSLPTGIPSGISAINISPALRDRLKSMGVEAVLSGSVIEYGYRSELESEPVVGVNWMMTDLGTGKILWSVGVSGVGSCFLGCRETLTSLSGRLIRREVRRFVNR